MELTGPDHVVLVSPDPEPLVDWYAAQLGLEVLRLEEWRRDEVPFVSLRVSPTFLIDVMAGDRTGVNVDHLALTVHRASTSTSWPARAPSTSSSGRPTSSAPRASGGASTSTTPTATASS